MTYYNYTLGADGVSHTRSFSTKVQFMNTELRFTFTVQLPDGREVSGLTLQGAGGEMPRPQAYSAEAMPSDPHVQAGTLARDGLWRAQDEAYNKGSVRVVHESDDPSKRIVVTPVLRVISCEPIWWPEAPPRNDNSSAAVG